MKPLILLVVSFFTLSACGQSVNDTINIFRNISSEICACALSNWKDSKPSGTLDSCREAIVLKYNERLKQIGFDPSREVGFWKLYNEVDRKSYLYCPELTKLIQKQYDGGKLRFSGELVSQKKLSSELYEVTISEVGSNEKKVFLAKSPIDERIIDEYAPGYVMTVEYEIVKNDQTKKDEYYLIDSRIYSIMGAVKKAAQ